MHIAYFSPLNPIESGISDYSEELLPYLAKYAQIDLLVDGFRPSNPDIATQFAVHDLREFPRRKTNYDVALYQMGNHPVHAGIYRTLLRFPGVTVLHDLVLHHLIAWLSFDRGDARTYLEEMRYAYGEKGDALARQVIEGHARFDLFEYPLCQRAVRSSLGIIVHSDYVRRAVEETGPGVPVRKVPMGVPLPPLIPPAEARARLGIAPDAFVVASFGHVNPFKRINSALRAFQALVRQAPNALYVLVGSQSPNYNVAGVVGMLGLAEKVQLTGHVDRAMFSDYVAAADVCVNLRYPTAGETSASVLRLMGAAKPVLVSRAGAFAELPNDACAKVDADEHEERLILEYLLLLADRPDVRAAMGANARHYVAEQHTLEGAARDYIGFLTDLGFEVEAAQPKTQAAAVLPITASTPSGDVKIRLLDDIGTALTELGIVEGDKEILQEVSRTMAEFEL
jgi:glycosyltransferase involved in cell wall biosynthesis